MADNSTKGKFEPKTAVELAPPKDDPITLEYLSKCDGKYRIPHQLTGSQRIKSIEIFGPFTKLANQAVRRA